MNTPQTITSLSASLAGMTPAATLSATAFATDAWAGPNICTACFMPLIVTLVTSTVAGLQIRFGASTASRLVWPCDWFASALANATPTGPSFDPIIRSMCAISLPSPTSDSPMYMDMVRSPWCGHSGQTRRGLTICGAAGLGKREKRGGPCVPGRAGVASTRRRSP
jgi:hypothetical protein